MGGVGGAFGWEGAILLHAAQRALEVSYGWRHPRPKE